LPVNGSVFCQKTDVTVCSKLISSPLLSASSIFIIRRSQLFLPKKDKKVITNRLKQMVRTAKVVYPLDLHLACVTSKNCWQQGALLSVTKLSEIGVINSGKGIVVKSGRSGGN
jgi:hypothetical protein